MKKRALLLFIPFVLFSCNKNPTDMPKSPFDDHYVRTGMVGKYDVDLTSLQASEYAALKSAVDEYNSGTVENDKKVTRVTRNEEMRDLKYAYFGNEVSAVSLCAMLSRTDTESRYTKNGNNYVTTKEAISNQQNQTANAGIIKTNSTTTDYIYDANYLNSGTTAGTKYGVRTSVKNNDEDAVVTQSTDLISYESTKFDLLPYTSDIKSHFNPTEVRKVPYDFDVLTKGNAVYGKCSIDGKERYLIKEGYSLFAPYTTTIGRTYKAVDNYFYEGLLEKYPTVNEGDSFRFTSFRFYHELLILSKAYDGINVPVLYLEKPVVIEYSEITYDISYEGLGDYPPGMIPEITPTPAED